MPDCVPSFAVNNPKTADTGCADKPALPFDRQWQQENQHAISDYNGLVELQGVFSEGLRAF